MLISRDNFSQHLVWAIIFLIGCIAVVAVFFYKGHYEYPGGSSVAGLTCGIISALLILFECLLWPRKKLRRWRLGRVRTWVAAHLWLGVLTVPFAIAHAGFQWGGAVAVWTMVLLLIVVSSGLYGVVMQNWLPKKMLREVPKETLISQIDEISKQYLIEADALVATTSGMEISGAGEKFWTDINPGHDPAGKPVMGVSRTIAAISGTAVITKLPKKSISGTRLLHQAYEDSVRGYLEFGKAGKSILKSRSLAGEFFDDLRNRSNPEAHFAVDSLENWCDQRRQFDSQKTIHFWLHSWLALHLPLSIALLVMLMIHVVVALKYSGIFSVY